MILRHLRNKAERKIVIPLLKHNMCTFIELLEYACKAQSTVSEHIKKLKEAAIVSVRHNNPQYTLLSDKQKTRG
jgi:DNA-binding transcriptional ArsR family regulator